jgi:integrase
LTALDRHFQGTAYQGDDDLVFAHPDTGSPYDPSKMRSRFYAAINRAGISRLRFHDLRHTFGTLMAAAGVPMRTLQEWMGHANLTTTEIYAHYAPRPDDQKWVERAFAGQSAGDAADVAEATPGPVEDGTGEAQVAGEAGP